MTQTHGKMTTRHHEAMTKIVINCCYGGFSLSDEAVREYLRRTGRVWSEVRRFDLVMFDVVGDGLWSPRDIPRDDPALVALVEEWGARANGDCAALEIRTLPVGTRYRIDEYDGFEGIETRDSIEWSVA